MEGDRIDLTAEDLHWYISIHSLRMEGDYRFAAQRRRHSHFNPLPPYGGRLSILSTISLILSFQSTPSVWRETMLTGGNTRTKSINFNPLPPYGGRQCFLYLFYERSVFQSTPSVWRETCGCHRPHAGEDISIHSLRMEGDMDMLIMMLQF